MNLKQLSPKLYFFRSKSNPDLHLHPHENGKEYIFKSGWKGCALFKERECKKLIHNMESRIKEDLQIMRLNNQILNKKQ